jgi:hypothetical protein
MPPANQSNEHEEIDERSAHNTSVTTHTSHPHPRATAAYYFLRFLGGRTAAHYST